MTELTEQERRIVEWLRVAKPAMEGGFRGRMICVFWVLLKPKSFMLMVYKVCADAIERGDHRKAKP